MEQFFLLSDTREPVNCISVLPPLILGRKCSLCEQIKRMREKICLLFLLTVQNTNKLSIVPRCVEYFIDNGSWDASDAVRRKLSIVRYIIDRWNEKDLSQNKFW
jgi:hypothetical protein